MSIFLTLGCFFSFSRMVGEGAGCQKISKLSQKHLLLGKKVKNILDNKARFDKKIDFRRGGEPRMIIE